MQSKKSEEFILFLNETESDRTGKLLLNSSLDIAAQSYGPWHQRGFELAFYVFSNPLANCYESDDSQYFDSLQWTLGEKQNLR